MSDTTTAATPGPAPAPEGTPLLELRGVEGGYGPVQVLQGIDLTVHEGKVVVILGANGAGKTTTLRAISGMIKARGELRFAGQSLLGRSPQAIARLGIAHVPQGRGTFTELTVEENLRVGAYTRRNGVKADLERCYDWFPRLGERRNQHAGSLSGGEQQMLAIGRALMLKPRLLLLDEPSLGLAPLVVAELFRIVKGLNEEEGLSVLVVEQNANIALQTSSRAYVLEVGRVALEGSSAELQAHEGVRASYLGY